MKIQLENKQLVASSIIVGMMFCFIITLGDILVGSQLTFCIILGNILWGIIFGYLVFKFITRMKSKKSKV